VRELTTLSARELLAAYRGGELSPVEVVDALADRITACDPAVGAFTTVCLERARCEAKAAERAYRSGGAEGSLAGVPFAAKDIFDSEGVRTTYGSPMFVDNVPDADAEAVRRARRAGAILIGKAQTHEFAWGITSVNHLMGTSRNPWAFDRISGGSSGGSAVALATHQVPLALGSDTGGSIRVPSGFCGTVGFKPTFGRVSAAGVWPLARTLDHPGPMARTPSDAALLLETVAGVDSADPATENVPLGDLEKALRRGLENRTVGVCPALHIVPLAPDVQRVFDDALAVVGDLSARVEEVGFDEARLVYETFAVIQRAEALFTHTEAGLYPGHADEYGADVRGRLERAAMESAGDYLRASARRQRIRAAFARVFREVDVLLTPVAAGSPVRIGEEEVAHFGHALEFRELVMSYTVPQDLAGLPACSVRGGFDDLGIPVGVQFTATPWEDAAALAAAQAFFEATPDTQRPWPDLEPGAEGRRSTGEIASPEEQSPEARRTR
jgi:aspartyl-tRNA(Asn)/glutamyl-tRNA(Gln) amidotransferase subunit A